MRLTLSLLIAAWLLYAVGAWPLLRIVVDAPARLVQILGVLK